MVSRFWCSAFAAWDLTGFQGLETRIGSGDSGGLGKGDAGCKAEGKHEHSNRVQDMLVWFLCIVVLGTVLASSDVVAYVKPSTTHEYAVK